MLETRMKVNVNLKNRTLAGAGALVRSSVNLVHKYYDTRFFVDELLIPDKM